MQHDKGYNQKAAQKGRSDMTLFMPPKGLENLIRVENGDFVIDKNASPSQRAAFEEWAREVKETEREMEDPPLSVLEQ